MINQKYWEYLITISGGGGHLNATRALENRLKKKNIPLKVLDLMRSCASYGKTIGTLFTNIWDNAQKKGDLDKIKWLIKQEYLIDFLMYLPTVFAITKDLLSEKTLPGRVRITHPICLPAIFSAIEIVNFLKKSSPIKIERIDLYLTDFPTDKSEHFYSSLRRMSFIKRWANRIVLHSPALSEEIKNEKDFWTKMTSIKDLVVMKEDIPIHHEFYRKNLPSPKSACEIQICCETPRENSYFHKLANSHPKIFSKPPHKRHLTINIKKADKVALIMLGSQPTHDAMIAYLKEILKIQSSLNAPLKHPVFIFLACGSSEHHRNPLLEKVLSTMNEFSLTKHLYIIPFSKQPVFDIFGRADLSITRSGGLTTAELLAMKRKGKEQESKRVIIHTEKLTSAQKKKKPKHISSMKWRNTLNNPLWERGNADYLARQFPSSVAVEGPDTIGADLRYYLFSDKDKKTAKKASQVLFSLKKTVKFHRSL